MARDEGPWWKSGSFLFLGYGGVAGKCWLFVGRRWEVQGAGANMPIQFLFQLGHNFGSVVVVGGLLLVFHDRDHQTAILLFISISRSALAKAFQVECGRARIQISESFGRLKKSQPT